MATSTDVFPSVRAAFAALVDYAGLFPPAGLTLDDAQREYAAARTGPHAWMLGKFIIPARLLAESKEELEGPFSVIVDANPEALRSVAALPERGLAVGALECSLSSDGVLDALTELQSALAAAGFHDVPAFAEIPRGDGWAEALPAAMSFMSRAGLNAKLRCGGITPDAFPSVDEVAGFIAAAATARVPFKATAGLHHPVRHVDPNTGFTMHGFLNLIAAAALAPRVDRAMLRRIVAEEEASAFAFDDAWFAWRDARVGTAELQRMRREAFVAYGSCSFAEPIDDLTALGLLPQR